MLIGVVLTTVRIRRETGSARRAVVFLASEMLALAVVFFVSRGVLAPRSGWPVGPSENPL